MNRFGQPTRGLQREAASPLSLLSRVPAVGSPSKSPELPPLDLAIHEERAARLGHNLLRPPVPPPPGPTPASVQRTLGVQTDKGRVSYRRKGSIAKNVPESIGNRTLIVSFLIYWGQLDEERHFDSWEDAIDQAGGALIGLFDHPRQEEIFDLLGDRDFDAGQARELRGILVVEPEVSRAQDLRATSVQPIDVAADKASVPVIDHRGVLQESIDFVHPIFADVVQADGAFLIVLLPEGADADFFARPIVYEGQRYRLDLTAGSSIKPAPGRSGRAFAIEEGASAKIGNLLGFEEAVYYAQRALFPLVSAGVTGRIRTRAYPQEEGMQHVFRLQDGTPVQVDDGWGYIKKSLAGQMELGGLQYEKRKPKAESGRASHQMLGWFDDEDADVVHELVQQGVERWQAAVAQHEATSNNPSSQDHFESRRVLQSLLTTGKPPMEMAVAMPVTGSDLVVPRDEKRYTRGLPGEVSVIRSPADKQNFRPVPAERVEQRAQISRLVGEIEGIQYTLTGSQDDQLTFFKGMVGVIGDELWPDDWKGVDLVVSSKDRKLFEKWVRDTSLEQDPEPADDPETDRAAMTRMRQDFTLVGTLAAVQWFEKGSFVGVPPAIQKWLGGDYDGDEVAMVFGARNPALQAYVRDRAFQEEEVNPKLTKTFTHNPGASRSGRITAMRSPNVGIWSNLAAQVRSLPLPLRSGLAEATTKGRLLRPDPALASLSEVGRMEKEIQLGIKVGTDGYKTSVSVTAFEERARVYSGLLRSMVEPIAHNKKLLDVLELTGVFPTLQAPAWANIFFRYDEVDRQTGEYTVRGVSARVLRHMIWNLLPPDDQMNVAYYYGRWKETEGFDPSGRRVPNVNFALESIDAYTGDYAGTAYQAIARIDFRTIAGFDDFVRQFLAARRGLSRNPRRIEYVDRQQGKERWVGGLLPLLQRYFRG